MTDPKIDVVALAKLARLEVTTDELKKLENEIPEILDFVEVIHKANDIDIAAEIMSRDIHEKLMNPAQRNVMREDANPHESGLYTKKLLDAAPAQEKDQVVVKQVLRQK